MYKDSASNTKRKQEVRGSIMNDRKNTHQKREKEITTWQVRVMTTHKFRGNLINNEILSEVFTVWEITAREDSEPNTSV